MSCCWFAREYVKATHFEVCNFLRQLFQRKTGDQKTAETQTDLEVDLEGGSDNRHVIPKNRTQSLSSVVVDEHFDCNGGNFNGTAKTRRHLKLDVFEPNLISTSASITEIQLEDDDYVFTE